MQETNGNVWLHVVCVCVCVFALGETTGVGFYIFLKNEIMILFILQRHWRIGTFAAIPPQTFVLLWSMDDVALLA